MISPVEALFALIVLTGASLIAIGYAGYKRWDQLGLNSLIAFAILLGIVGLGSGLMGILLGPNPNEAAMPHWAQLGIFIWAVATVPWILFALQYTGRYRTVGSRLVGALYLPFLGFGVTLLYNVGGIGWPGIVNALTSVIFLYCFALAFLGTFLILHHTQSYVHLSLKHGILISALPIAVVLTLNSARTLQQSSNFLAVGAYFVAYTGGSALFATSLLRSPLLDRTPAVDTIGEKAITRESEDLIFVVDQNDTITKANVTAAETLTTLPEPGASVGAVLGSDSETLAANETVSLETVSGTRQYDPQVSPISDGHGTELGAILSLRDVTERELRQQRLKVLNRALRHNLRNNVDVVKSHAEVIADEHDAEHPKNILSAADSITNIGDQARRIDQFLSQADAKQEVDLVEIVASVIADLDADDGTVELTTDMPDSMPVETNRLALKGAVESAVENAIDYADSAVDITVERIEGDCMIRVHDDGPGIPESELAAIDAGTETPLQHGTGLGLWQLQWAVRTMGGTLSFDVDDGTTVEFAIPDSD